MSLPQFVQGTVDFKGRTLWIVPEIPGYQGEGKAYSRCFFCDVQELDPDPAFKDLICKKGVACGYGKEKTIGIYPEHYDQYIAHATSLKLTGEP